MIHTVLCLLMEALTCALQLWFRPSRPGQRRGGPLAIYLLLAVQALVTCSLTPPHLLGPKPPKPQSCGLP